jgi:hypothetical protein
MRGIACHEPIRVSRIDLIERHVPGLSSRRIPKVRINFL